MPTMIIGSIWRLCASNSPSQIHNLRFSNASAPHRRPCRSEPARDTSIARYPSIIVSGDGPSEGLLVGGARSSSFSPTSLIRQRRHRRLLRPWHRCASGNIGASLSPFSSCSLALSGSNASPHVWFRCDSLFDLLFRPFNILLHARDGFWRRVDGLE
jgi:hypothetical protein